MADKGKAPTYPTDGTVPAGSPKSAKPWTEYEEYMRRCRHPGWISVMSEDTEPSEDSSSTSPSRSRTRSQSPHVAAPAHSPIPPIGNRGARVITSPRKSTRPGPSVSFRMPPPPPPPVRTSTPAPPMIDPLRHHPRDEHWMPPRHSVYDGPSVLAGDRYSQSSRRASDVGPSDAALDEILKTVRRHELTLQHATRTSQSAQFQAMMASQGVQRLEQERRKKNIGWLGWLKKKWM